MDEAEPTEVAAREPPKKSKVGTVIAAIAALAVAAGAGIFGSGMLHKEKAAHSSKADKEDDTGSDSEGDSEGDDDEGEHGGKDAPPAETIPMPQVVIDVRDKDGDVHHLKVGLQFEAAHLPEEEFAKCMPRGREALVTYLRTLTFESATDPKDFEKIKKEISDRTRAAIGKKRVKRVLVTDFVGQ